MRPDYVESSWFKELSVADRETLQELREAQRNQGNMQKLQTKPTQQPEMPFSLFISMERRRRLLDAMMAKDDTDRKRGEKILNNYKR